MGRPFVKGEGMDYVLPNGIIQLGTVNGLDDRYMHTLYFANESAQNTFMANKLTKQFDKTSYLRMDAGILKIQTPYYNVYKCNYMRFKNQTTVDAGNVTVTREDKWYYAFINGVEYVNEKTTLIHYTIDDLQTWLIGASINACLVEREHVNRSEDQWKLHLEPEPIGSELYDLSGDGNNDYLYLDSYSNYICAVTMSNKGNLKHSDTVSTNDVTGEIEGLMTGAYTYCIGTGQGTPSTQQSYMKTAMASLQNKINGSWEDGVYGSQVISAYMYPTKYVTDTVSAEDFEPPLNPKTINHTITMPTKFDQFIPENKKMFTYPYSYLLCCTANGVGGELKWELFDGDIGQTITIRGYGHCSGVPEIGYLPLQYNGQAENKQHAMIVGNFPQVPITVDAYQAWLASGGETKARTAAFISAYGSAVSGVSAIFGGVNQGMNNYDSGADWTKNYNQYILSRTQGRLPQLNQGAMNAVKVGATNYANQNTNMLSSVASGLLGAPASVAGAALGVYSAAKKLDYTFKDARYMPNQIVGSPTAGLMVAHRLEGMYFYHCHVHDSEARKLDEFLTMYGYAVNRVKVPNLTGRQYWNFVKTNGSSISGDMPASAMANICRILDGGICFWHGDYVGNFHIGYNSATNKQVITNPVV